MRVGRVSQIRITRRVTNEQIIQENRGRSGGTAQRPLCPRSRSFVRSFIRSFIRLFIYLCRLSEMMRETTDIDDKSTSNLNDTVSMVYSEYIAKRLSSS